MKLTTTALTLIALASCSLTAKTLEQIQEIHRDIGNELMGIRKEFTAAQPKIYALLDRVDRMYNLAKNSAEKKHLLKIDIQNKNTEIKKLNSDLVTLKNKLQVTEKELEKYSNKFIQLDKELQVEKVQAAILSREKMELAHEKHILQSQMSNIKSEPVKEDSKKDMIPESILSNLTEEEKDILKNSQNLSLSSTSAPSSPR